MSKKLFISKFVLGTQFSKNYGVTRTRNITKKKSFELLEFAWTKGIRYFDTAPTYDSEKTIGEFIKINKLHRDIKILTKISKFNYGFSYEDKIFKAIEISCRKLKSSIEVLFFHDFYNSKILFKNEKLIEKILKNFPVKNLGVSIYDPEEYDILKKIGYDLSFQFPINFVDRRFQQLMHPNKKRFARSIFLQGILVSKKIRNNLPNKIKKFHNNYHNLLTTNSLDPLKLALSYIYYSKSMDYFLIGIENTEQITNIFNTTFYSKLILEKIDINLLKYDNIIIDPRKW